MIKLLANRTDSSWVIFNQVCRYIVQLNPAHSFGGKIFIFSTFIVLLSVSIIGFDYVSDINQLLTQEYMTQSLDRAERYGQQTKSLVQEIEIQIISLSQQIANKRKSRVRKQIRQLKKRFPSYIGIMSVKQNNNSFTFDQSFGPIQKARKKIIRKLKNIAKKESLNATIHALDKKQLMLIRKFTVDKSNQAFWVVGIFKSTLIEPLFDVSEKQDSYILDSDYRDLYSYKKYSQFFSKASHAKKIIKSIKSDSGASFIRDITDNKNQLINVTFYQIPIYNIAIVFHRQADNLFTSIKAILVKVSQKVILVILIAIMIGYILTKSITSNLAEVMRGTLRIASGDFQSQVPIKSKDEIGVLAQSVNHMSQVIRNLLLSEKEKVRFEKELETAQTVQSAFFKEEYFENGPIHISSYYKPASECCGDWWGRFTIKQGVEMVVVGDATGHGVPAALITAIAYATTNSFAHRAIAQGGVDHPSMLLYEINNILYNTLKGQFCMTFIVMVIDSINNQITYSNGGHLFPLLIAKYQNDPRIKNKRAKKQRIPIHSISGEKSSSILGLSDDAQFTDNTLNLVEGDRIIICSDGITEARNEKKKIMGNRGLNKMLQSIDSLNCQDLTKHIINGTIEYNHENDKFEDDLTLVVVEFEPSAGAQTA